MEQYTNNPGSTLGGSINNAVTTLTVASATSFPPDGTFSIIIGTEIMTVTAVSGTTFTVLRGQEGTTAVSHTAGDAVDGSLTKRALDQIRADCIIFDNYANRPAAGTKGRLFIASEGGMQFVDDGTDWQGFSGTDRLYDPNLYSFSWLNQGSTLLFQFGSDQQLTVGTNTNVISGRIKAAPTPPYFIEMKFSYGPTAGSSSSSYFSFCWGFRNSSSGKMHNFMQSWNSSVVQYWSEKYSDFSTFNATYSNYGHGRDLEPMAPWLRLRDDGTTRYGDVSYNGRSWVNIDLVSRTDYFTPDQVYWGLRDDASNAISMTQHSYREY